MFEVRRLTFKAKAPAADASHLEPERSDRNQLPAHLALCQKTALFKAAMRISEPELAKASERRAQRRRGVVAECHEAWLLKSEDVHFDEGKSVSYLSV